MDQSTSCTLQCFFPLLLYFCLFSLDSVASAALLNSEPPNPVNPLGISTFKELFIITCTCMSVEKRQAVAETQRIVR